MIEEYSYNACPVIEEVDLKRAILALPKREVVNVLTKSDTYSVFLDGNEEKFVTFDWDEKAKGWRLRNRLVFPIKQPEYHCNICSKVTEHIINKDVTRKKCKICSTVTDIVV
jgi:hypothetical protein